MSDKEKLTKDLQTIMDKYCGGKLSPLTAITEMSQEIQSLQSTVSEQAAEIKRRESEVRMVFSKWLSEYQDYKDGDFDRLIEGLDKTIQGLI